VFAIFVFKFYSEGFENTNGIIRSLKSKDRQYKDNNTTTTTTKRQTMIYKILCRKLKIEQQESH